MELKEYLNSINYDKKPLMDNDEIAAKEYPAYVVNRCLSYFNDTIFYANEMNCKPILDSKAQFDFYRLGVRKKKRYSYWLRKEKDDKINLIKQAFSYSESKAREVLNIIGPKDLDNLKKSLDKGGPTNL
jgi:hypothetical protein